jgi:hypothetical protein
VPTTVARRLERLEAVERANMKRRHDAGIRAMGATMAPEHIDLIQSWMHEHCGGHVLVRLPGESWYDILERLKPPALVRASWLLMAHHVIDGTPASLAPAVAEVYVSDLQAYPINECDGCGYLLPGRARLRPDGTYRQIGWYMGACPVCGLDNHPKEEEPS